MLAVHRPDELRRALTTEDVKTLTTVPGIGQKGAQRIILELKDRIGAPSGGAAPRTATAPTTSGEAWRGQVHAGLVGLGWSAKEADRAVEAVSPQAEEMVATTVDGSTGPTTVDVAALLRAALRSLSKA
jgi:Holliday junction DNA helicase RuvA